MSVVADTENLLKRATIALGRNVASLTIPERALILAETLERPLSPAKFAAEWGLERTATQRHFRRMTDSGFLRVVDKEPSNGGRDRLVYVATQNLLLRGTDWTELSQEEREGHSFVVFITLMSRISLSIGAKTMDRDLDRHFSWKALRIDKPVWQELLERLDDALDWITREEAADRRANAADQLIPSSVALAGFRSPSRWELRDGVKISQPEGKFGMPDPQHDLKRAAAALGPGTAKLVIPERALILAETLDRPLSPAELAAEWGLSRHTTARHFRKMERAGFLERLDPVETPGRGRALDPYTATRNLVYRLKEWENLSQKDREGHSFVVFVTLMARISLSINMKTMDRDLDRHFSWKALQIARSTWEALMKRLDDLLDWIIEAESGAHYRIDTVGEDPIWATVALAGFRSPTRRDLLSWDACAHKA